MVSQKRLDYGFNGYQLPPTPRAARSARRNGSFRKRAEGNEMCAFDLLATVAGNLLLEGDTSPSSSNILNGKEQCGIAKDSLKRDQEDRDKNLKVEPCDLGRCDRGSIVSKFVSQAPEYISKELPNAQNDTCFELTSVTSSDIFEKVVSQEKLVNDTSKIEVGTFGDKVEVSSNGYKVSCDCVVEDDKKKQIKTELPKTGKLAVTTRADMTSSVDQVVWDRKPPALVSVNNVVKVPLCRDHISGGLVIRDDDENSSGCTQPSTVTKAFRPPTRIGDHRVRNLLASKYWKVTPKLKDEEHSCSDAEIKPVCRSQINSYKRQRSQRDYPFKKRKLYYRSSVSNSDGGISSEGLSSSHEKGFSKDTSDLDSTVHGVTGTSTSVASQHAFFQSMDSDGVRDFGAAVLGATETSDSVSGQNTSFHSRDSHVKLRIKSLKVPELFIEIPETATVGSLKRTVMEAVTAILGCGLRVGVLLQGKKVRDDNKTLQQTGISHDKKLDALGFTLEPNPMQALPPPCHDDHSFLLPCGASQPVTRYPSSRNDAHNVVKQGTPDASLDHPATNLGNIIESDHDSAPSSPDIVDKRTASRALVAVPAMNVEALAVVPMQKSKRSEVVQRRVRRPFSVSEVEALVQAVEKLGTGRWREVKLRAFDNAKHRTYVDLKDKWKTLVHTARISPQQRRGEPVPQELLDRVLSAHAYWSQQQQLKQQSETCRLL